MSENTPRQERALAAEHQAARRRLANRHGDLVEQRLARTDADYGLPPLTAVERVAAALAMEHLDPRGPHIPAAPADIDDALRLLPSARTSLDQRELYLLDGARSEGRSWAEIAAIVGDREAVDQIAARYEQLRGSFPGYRPRPPAASLAAVDDSAGETAVRRLRQYFVQLNTDGSRKRVENRNDAIERVERGLATHWWCE